MKKPLKLIKYKILHVFIITTNTDNIMEHSIINKILPRCYFKYIFNPILYNIIWPLKYNKKLCILFNYKSKVRKMSKYALLDAKVPELSFGITVKDPKVGGIKLVYSKSKEYSLKAETEKVIFLKPYKTIWEPRGKKFCKKSEWGNTSSPFANVWLKIYEDYTNYENYIKENGFIPNEIVINITLIKKLNTKTATFTINETDDNPTTHIGIKIALWMMNNIIIPIKERIFINNKKTK